MHPFWGASRAQPSPLPLCGIPRPLAGYFQDLTTFPMCVGDVVRSRIIFLERNISARAARLVEELCLSNSPRSLKRRRELWGFPQLTRSPHGFFRFPAAALLQEILCRSGKLVQDMLLYQSQG